MTRSRVLVVDGPHGVSVHSDWYVPFFRGFFTSGWRRLASGDDARRIWTRSARVGDVAYLFAVVESDDASRGSTGRAARPGRQKR